MMAPDDPAKLTPLISLSIDPRQRLLLFDIADDPDYVAMEIQVFDDATHGRGVLVLLQRHDATVDVYRQPDLRLDPGPFSVGRGLGIWQATTIEPARLEVEPDGVVAEIALVDAAGRRIEVAIDDRDGVQRRRSTLLAPVGSGVADPKHFFVVLMRDFDLGRTSGREPVLRIGGEARAIKPFPGPAWLHRRRFIRYAGDPVIVILNPDQDGPIDPAALGPVGTVTALDGATSAAIRFEPPLPALRALPGGGHASGTWVLDVADVPHLTGGSWSADRTGDRVDLSMSVTSPWRPRALPWSLRLVTTVARVFRDWPTTYRWTATLDLAADPPMLRSAWHRTAAPNAANAYGVRRLPVRALLRAFAVAATALMSLAVVRRARRPRSVRGSLLQR